MKIRFLLTALASTIAFAGLVLPAPASATSVIRLSDDQQALRSDAVAVVRVEAIDVWEHPEFHSPMTTTTLRVDELLWGSAPQQLGIQQMGGRLDEKKDGKVESRITYVPGDARFKVGEVCVVFLKKNDSTWFLTAMAQSKYEIVSFGGGRSLPMLRRTLTGGVMVYDEIGRLVGDPAAGRPEMRTLRGLREALKVLRAGLSSEVSP